MPSFVSCKSPLRVSATRVVCSPRTMWEAALSIVTLLRAQHVDVTPESIFCTYWRACHSIVTRSCAYSVNSVETLGWAQRVLLALTHDSDVFSCVQGRLKSSLGGGNQQELSGDATSASIPLQPQEKFDGLAQGNVFPSEILNIAFKDYCKDNNNYSKAIATICNCNAYRLTRLYALDLVNARVAKQTQSSRADKSADHSFPVPAMLWLLKGVVGEWEVLLQSSANQGTSDQPGEKAEIHGTFFSHQHALEHRTLNALQFWLSVNVVLGSGATSTDSEKRHSDVHTSADGLLANPSCAKGVIHRLVDLSTRASSFEFCCRMWDTILGIGEQAAESSDFLLTAVALSQPSDVAAATRVLVVANQLLSLHTISMLAEALVKRCPPWTMARALTLQMEGDALTFRFLLDHLKQVAFSSMGAANSHRNSLGWYMAQLEVCEEGSASQHASAEEKQNVQRCLGALRMFAAPTSTTVRLLQHLIDAARYDEASRTLVRLSLHSIEREVLEEETRACCPRLTLPYGEQPMQLLYPKGLHGPQCNMGEECLRSTDWISTSLCLLSSRKLRTRFVLSLLQQCSDGKFPCAPNNPLDLTARQRRLRIISHPNVSPWIADAVELWMLNETLNSTNGSQTFQFPSVILRDADAALGSGSAVVHGIAKRFLAAAVAVEGHREAHRVQVLTAYGGKLKDAGCTDRTSELQVWLTQAEDYLHSLSVLPAGLFDEPALTSLVFWAMQTMVYAEYDETGDPLPSSSDGHPCGWAVRRRRVVPLFEAKVRDAVRNISTCSLCRCGSKSILPPMLLNWVVAQGGLSWLEGVKLLSQCSGAAVAEHASFQFLHLPVASELAESNTHRGKVIAAMRAAGTQLCSSGMALAPRVVEAASIVGMVSSEPQRVPESGRGTRVVTGMLSPAVNEQGLSMNPVVNALHHRLFTALLYYWHREALLSLLHHLRDARSPAAGAPAPAASLVSEVVFHTLLEAEWRQLALEHTRGERHLQADSRAMIRPREGRQRWDTVNSGRSTATPRAGGAPLDEYLVALSVSAIRDAVSDRCSSEPPTSCSSHDCTAGKEQTQTADAPLPQSPCSKSRPVEGAMAHAMDLLRCEYVERNVAASSFSSANLHNLIHCGEPHVEQVQVQPEAKPTGMLSPYTFSSISLNALCSVVLRSSLGGAGAGG